MKRLLAILVASLAGGAGEWYVHAGDNTTPAGQSAASNRVASGEKLTAAGTIEPIEVVDIFAQVAGKIVKLGEEPSGKPIDFGSAVDVNTVLAQIDNELLAVQVERERAGCERAEAELEQAMINLERAEAQLEQAQSQGKASASSDTDLKLAKLNCKAAAASVRVAKAVRAQNEASLKHAEIELNHTVIKSPIKGIVVDRRVNVGQIVAPAANTPSLFLVAKVDQLQVWASVNEADISRIRPDQPVHISVDAYPNEVFEGRVKQTRLNATMTQNVVTYTVVVAISSTKEKLLPYMTAQVRFE